MNEEDAFFEELLGLPRRSLFDDASSTRGLLHGRDAAALFDAAVQGPPSSTAAHGVQIVARPGESVAGRVRPDDILIQRALGEGKLALVSTLATRARGPLGPEELVVRLPGRGGFEEELAEDAEATGFDTSFYYRLTNAFLGPGQALDVKPDGSGLLMMAPTRDHRGQHWRLVPHSGGRFRLQTWFLGDCFSLDVRNDASDDTPRLSPTGNFSGQGWTLTPWGDGTHKLTNSFTGPSKALDTYRDSHRPFLGPGNHTGQHWTLTRTVRIPTPASIPALQTSAAQPNLGASDPQRYATPTGTKRAVMVFVDFPNAEAGTTSATATANNLLGNGAAQRMFETQSYGKMKLRVDVKSGLGWRRLARPSTDFGTAGPDGTRTFPSQAQHRAYIEAMAAAFTPQEVRFSDYDFVYLVAPPNAGFSNSPAFPATASEAATTPSGPIRHAVTFGTDSYTNRFTNLVHETAHLIGMPDLYPYPDPNDSSAPSGAEASKAGCWAMMSDIFRANGFLGWLRHKVTWMDPSRVELVTASPWWAVISPLDGDCGRSMLVVPIDSTSAPTRMLVIELAQAVRGTDGTTKGEGVLVYTVDGSITSGRSPLVVRPRVTSHSSVYGNLHEAPFGVGQSLTFVTTGASVTVKVLQKFRSSYDVKVEIQRR